VRCLFLDKRRGVGCCDPESCIMGRWVRGGFWDRLSVGRFLVSVICSCAVVLGYVWFYVEEFVLTD